MVRPQNAINFPAFAIASPPPTGMSSAETPFYLQVLKIFFASSGVLVV
jgi:hypothetical protein